jgi:hypothetical protein
MNLAIVSCEKAVLTKKMVNMKKVVVPNTIHAKCAAMIHENNAYISSALNGRVLRMVSHLKWIFIRDQKPDAASSSSALLGRYMWGRWCGRRSRRGFAALAASGFGFGGVFEALGGESGWGDSWACGV